MKENESILEKKDFDDWYKRERSTFFLDEDTNIVESPDVITSKMRKAEEELFDFAMNSMDSAVIEKCYDLFARILLKRIGEPDFILNNCSEIVSSGFNAYQNKAFREAEGYFSVIAELDINNSSKNNLAYMIRRGEVIQPQNKLISRALVLLRDGVKERDSFSLINTALILALNIGGGDAWDIADKLVSRIEGDSVDSVISWWSSVDEKEGSLVHLWLQRHSLMGDVSVWGTKNLLAKRINTCFTDVPRWIVE